ncbi:MAG: transposase, partial [Pseudomonadales bacterium]|nr:transposase [Pseudomonadales bacterium]
PNQPLHIIHRGNNRQDIFESEQDMIRIKEDIKLALSKTSCRLHAYVIMSNHLHLLVTPIDRESLAFFMQCLSNRYVRYYNAKHGRTGTLWEGRYKSSVIDSTHYLFTLYKYIEMNPVKAGMVKSPANYPWSSYSRNALAAPDDLVTDHKLYKALGKTTDQRCSSYKSLFDETDISSDEGLITQATMRGEVFGDKRFHKRISRLIKRPTKLTSHGGDRKSESFADQAG